MGVAQLIEALQNMPAHLPVYVESQGDGMGGDDWDWLVIDDCVQENVAGCCATIKLKYPWQL